MESIILGCIFFVALFYFGYKLYPKKHCDCGCGGSKKSCCKNPKQ
ncbi:hypothetical protein [Helicobacter sp. MIT 05-5294]|nr:hypothetical protein [Helicobacter sp. MIT 05-5294]